MDITKFNEKLNKLEGNIYTIEEAVTPVDGVYEGVLAHDNVELSTLNIYTGSKLTGDKINTYTTSTPSLTPWKTNITIYSTVPVYITYETTGDTVEAEDINNVQDAINDTQKELNKEVDRATNKEAELSENISSEVIRATNKESALQNSINNEATRAKSAEKTLTDNLSKEVSRASSAESILTTNLDKEISRAKAKESSIDTELDNRYTKDKVFTKDEVLKKIKELIGTAPEVLDTFGEIATALGNDPNFATTITTMLAGKVDKVTGKQLSTNDFDNTQKSNLTDCNNKKHTHSNKSVLDGITSALITAWNNAVTHISDTVKHITSAERTLWNTVSSKSDKGHTHDLSEMINTLAEGTATPSDGDYYVSQYASGSQNTYHRRPISALWEYIKGKANGVYAKISHTHTKSQITDMPTKLSQFTNDSGFITAKDVDTSQNHTHSNKSVLDKITQTKLNAWNDGARKVAFVGSDAEGTNGWYKVASQTCSGYGNANITFMVTSTYGNYHSGILQLQIRSDNNNIGCTSFKWLSRIGFSISNFIIVINGMTWTLYVNQPSTRYGRICFEILSLSSTDSMGMAWTLNFANNGTKEATAPRATVTSSDGATVNYANSSSSATKATQDSDGKQINTTYVKKGMTWNELEGI